MKIKEKVKSDVRLFRMGDADQTYVVYTNEQSFKVRVPIKGQEAEDLQIVLTYTTTWDNIDCTPRSALEPIGQQAIAVQMIDIPEEYQNQVLTLLQEWCKQEDISWVSSAIDIDGYGA
jgi:hypothetical protein